MGQSRRHACVVELSDKPGQAVQQHQRTSVLLAVLRANQPLTWYCQVETKQLAIWLHLNTRQPELVHKHGKQFRSSWSVDILLR